jgi:predicted Ser/Thr protein kinase
MANGWTQVGLGTLPPGTVVDGWRVVEVLGRGGNGTVYGAEPLESGGGVGRCALKMASRPHDLRYEREVELLSRTHHPRVPRLYGHGWWKHPSGVAFAYLVMERIEGVGLYEWATQKAPSSGQVLRVLADVASALEATHRAGCVHRDVKGENVLVSASGHGYLIDFGAGDFQGARTLTEEVLPPGTPYYRSPQALRFQWKHRRQKGAHYEPGPADDVYALGVTGYMLVTGGAPECRVDPAWEADPKSGPPPPPLVAPRELATVSPELNTLLVRMLSDEPQARGNSGEVAVALEQAARRRSRKAEAPIVPRPQDSSPPGLSGRRRTRRVAGFAAAVGCALLAACAWWIWQRAALLRQAPLGGAVAVGDAGPLTAHTAAPRTPSTGLKLDMPKKPFPGQVLPPCREGFETEIELTEGNKDTRSCWLKVDAKAGKCKANGYEYKEGCYVPVYPPVPIPQSAKP